MTDAHTGIQNMKVKYDPGAFPMTRAYPTDAGLDIRTPVDFTIWPGGRVCIDTGIHVQIPPGYCGRITSKSGLMRDNGITSEGLIDSSYRGAINAVIFNHTNKIHNFKRGQKITQLVIQSCETPKLETVDELDETDRGSDGFGSTGA